MYGIAVSPSIASYRDGTSTEGSECWDGKKLKKVRSICTLPGSLRTPIKLSLVLTT